MASNIRNIVIVGSGNVAERLVDQFIQLDLKVSIKARPSAKASKLASHHGIPLRKMAEPITADVDLVLLCVSDGAIKTVAHNLKLESTNTIIAHTSGSMPSFVFTSHEYRGCFYPLQTIRSYQDIDFKEVPLLITSSSPEVGKTLMNLASQISDRAEFISDDQKSVLHVAAVMANNFTNYILAETYQYCKEYEVPFRLLVPLIEETFEKYTEGQIDDTQTGPAVRNDQITLKRHRQILRGNHDRRNLYNYLTNRIKDKHK